MKIYSTRHGQTNSNLDNKICGVSDVYLTINGLEQAKQLAKEIRMFGDVDVIISSPLKRAVQTATIVAEEIGLSFVTDERLSEWDYGSFEDEPRNHPDFPMAKIQFGCKMGGYGESLLKLSHRIYSFLEELKDTYYNENILLISHGGVCRVIETYFNDMTVEEFLNFFMGNCEVRKYDL